MHIFELIEGLLELLASWRFYLCLIPALLLTWLIHENIESEAIAWTLSIPILVFFVGLGMYWESRRG